MPLDRQAKRFLDMISAGGQSDAGYDSAIQRRQALRDLAASVGGEPPPVGAVRDVALEGPGGSIGARLYTPLHATGSSLPGMLFFHGGGWVAGDLETHDGVCRRLANASGCRVIAVDYRLAPEHPFPAAVNDAVAALEWVADQAAALGVDVTRLGVAGDSAGAGLAAGLCQHALAHGGPKIAFQLLICPILDVFAESTSRLAFAEGYFLNRAVLERDLELYGPSIAARADPRLSPLRSAELGGLQPALIHTAEFDPFRDEGEAYAEALDQAGVAVSRTRHEGMIHYFYAMPLMIARAETALSQMGAEVARLLGPSEP